MPSPQRFNKTFTPPPPYRGGSPLHYSLTWSQRRQCTVLFKPSQDSPAKFIHSANWHHTIVRLKQMLQNNAKLQARVKGKNYVIEKTPPNIGANWSPHCAIPVNQLFYRIQFQICNSVLSSCARRQKNAVCFPQTSAYNSANKRLNSYFGGSSWPLLYTQLQTS